MMKAIKFPNTYYENDILFVSYFSAACVTFQDYNQSFMLCAGEVDVTMKLLPTFA